jgi:hypothetical protein
MTRERDIEQYLVAEVKRIGGLAYKFTSPGRRSVPDRLVLLTGGRAVFIECKAPGRTATDAQAREHERLWKLGFSVAIVDSREAVDRLVAKL